VNTEGGAWTLYVPPGALADTCLMRDPSPAQGAPGVLVRGSEGEPPA